MYDYLVYILQEQVWGSYLMTKRPQFYSIGLVEVSVVDGRRNDVRRVTYLAVLLACKIIPLLPKKCHDVTVNGGESGRFWRYFVYMLNRATRF